MKTYVKLIVLLLLSLLWVVGEELWTRYPTPIQEPVIQPVGIEDEVAYVPVEPLGLDSLGRDTTSQRILFFGDSMVEGLSRRLCDYAMENGDSLLTICWYGSTSQTWAESDTLDHYLRTYRPTYVLVSLCGNEQFVRDLPERERYLQSLLSRLSPIPFVWIATPTWRPSTGINDVVCRLVGERRFFDSTRLTFTRGSDHIHPTFGSSERWMDSIAVWMEIPEREYPLRMRTPTLKRPRHWQKVIIH